VLFAGSSGLLALLFGVALGNMVRGLPVTPDRRFTLAFFTDFTTHGEVGLLDYYTVSVGLLALVALLAHGAAFLAFRTDGVLRARARAAERRLWLVSGGLFVVVTVQTIGVRPELFSALATRPLAWLFAAIALGGVILGALAQRREQDARVFLSSSAVLAGLLAATATALYPKLIHSTLSPAGSITAQDALGAPYGLSVALAWWPVAFALAVTYVVFTFRSHREKLSAPSEHDSNGH
ncbi:MAG TPA: cytochrome d ubiquinol oxidase subunit II, partial [Polyangiaceae bacterium]